MSTVADSQRAPGPVAHGPDQQDARRRFTPPSLSRLILVELRKATDTRSGRWLLIASVAITAILAVVRAFTGNLDERTFADTLQVTLIPLGFLLPVLGILLVTSEWSQRTALTTFALVPERQRIAQSKIGAALILGFAAFAISVLMAAFGNLIANLATEANGSWSLTAGDIYQALIYQELSLLTGLGFGLLLMSPPLAIVAFFALPTVFTILGGLLKSLKSTWEWIDMSKAFDPLANGNASGDDWGKVLVAALIWIALPLAFGLVRLMRSEVK